MIDQSTLVRQLRARTYGPLPPEMWAAVPAIAIGIGTFSIAELVLDGSVSRLVASGLLLTTTCTWLLAPELNDRPVTFTLLALLPLAAVNVLGEALDIAGVTGDDPQGSLSFLPFGAAAALASKQDRHVLVLSLSMTVGILVGRCIAAGDVASFAPWFSGVALGCFAGWALERYSSTLKTLRLAQKSLAAMSRSDERRRIARDIHDIVSQSLAVVLLHVGSARMNLARNARDAADSLVRAEEIGRAGLLDVRRTLETIRTSCPDLPSQRLSLGDVPELLQRFRAAGVDLNEELEIASPASEVCGNAAYRIIQESLANAVSHGAGPIDVFVRSSDATLEVRVANAVGAGEPATGGGLGLVGMRERVSEVGGVLTTEIVTAADGTPTWVLAASLPRVTA